MNYAEKYAKWLDSNAVSDNEKDILKKLDEKEAEDSFYRDLEFGTGGLRGVMGLGTNRMNIYIVRQATQGLANEILDCGAEFAEKGVVIFQACKDESDLRIPWDNIVRAFYVKTHEGQNSLRIILLKNQPITIYFNKINLFQSEYVHYSRAIARLINEKACGVSPEDEGW